MKLAKALTLVAAAFLWLIVALAALFASFPLWGMSAGDALPPWMFGVFVLWVGSYVALAIWLIRLKKFP